VLVNGEIVRIGCGGDREVTIDPGMSSPCGMYNHSEIGVILQGEYNYPAGAID
jgi:hypothetical protein